MAKQKQKTKYSRIVEKKIKNIKMNKREKIAMKKKMCSWQVICIQTGKQSKK